MFSQFKKLKIGTQIMCLAFGMILMISIIFFMLNIVPQIILTIIRPSFSQWMTK